MTDQDDLKRRIVDSKLLAEAELEALADEAAKAEGSPGLLDFLAAQGRLTEFEAGALAAGFTGPFMLGPYRVHERIATARRGDLFRAVHVEFDQPVTLKVYSAAQAADPMQLARMRREIRVAVQLDHPNIIRSFQVSRVGSLYFIAFEDLRGESLAARLARKRWLELPQMARLGNQAALGLASMHEAGVVHGDFQPANLWIDEYEQLKIMEFGAARDSLSYLDQVEGSGATLEEQCLAGPSSAETGNPYVAPEAAADAQALDARSDVYSLGVVLFEGFTNELPPSQFDPKSYANRSFVWPTSLVELIRRMLAENPAERPALGEVSQELSQHYDESTMPATTKWNPDFLAWAEQANLPVADGSFFDSSPDEMTSEFAEFADWLSMKK